jgi:predicted chitinase
MLQVLAAVLLAGLMGLIGQGVRAAVGLKSAATLAATTPTQQSQFNAAYLMVSLMIGFIAGVLAGMAIGLDKVTGVAPDNIKVLLGLIAAGYAGVDFIENTFTHLIPGLGTPQQAGAAAGAAAAAPPAPPPQPAAAPAGTEIVGLAAALRAVAPKVDAGTWSPTGHRQMAAAVGQFLVEAGAAFQETAENLNYTHAERLREVFPHAFPTLAVAQQYVGNPQRIANRVYANRLGNGDEASGDGWRFRGRGLIQLTGRTEYAQFAASVGKTLDEVSVYSDTPDGAAMSGCWYLSDRGCIPLADSWQISEITRRVNGNAMLGNAQRIHYSNEMLKALGG